METLCLESVWRNKLSSLGWSSRCCEQFLLHWAPSTLRQYNDYIKHFCLYCADHGHDFPFVSEDIVAVYLCSLADSSERPRSKIYGTLAAFNAFYEALCFDAVSSNIRKFADALVKSSTNVPMNKTNIMPVQPFLKLFDSWQENDFLSIKNLRMKAICLLSLTFMLRPSDIAPRSVRFDSDVGS